MLTRREESLSKDCDYGTLQHRVVLAFVDIPSTDGNMLRSSEDKQFDSLYQQRRLRTHHVEPTTVSCETGLVGANPKPFTGTHDARPSWCFYRGQESTHKDQKDFPTGKI